VVPPRPGRIPDYLFADANAQPSGSRNLLRGLHEFPDSAGSTWLPGTDEDSNLN